MEFDPYSFLRKWWKTIAKRRRKMSVFSRNSDPDTSHEAAASMVNDVNRVEGIVERAIHGRGNYGATWDELADLTGIAKASISPRFKPLRERGLIRAGVDAWGRDMRRPGVSGRNQIVWVATT